LSEFVANLLYSMVCIVLKRAEGHVDGIAMECF